MPFDDGHLGLLLVRVGPGSRTAVAAGAALAALSLAATGEAALTARSGRSSLPAAAASANAHVHLDAVLLTPGREASGAWSQRRLPTHPAGLAGLLSLGALVLCLARAGTARVCWALQPLSLSCGTGRPRGPPLLQLT